MTYDAFSSLHLLMICHIHQMEVWRMYYTKEQMSFICLEEIRGSTTINSYLLHLEHWARILVQVTINRRLLIGRDGHLDQSEAYDLS